MVLRLPFHRSRGLQNEAPQASGIETLQCGESGLATLHPAGVIGSARLLPVPLQPIPARSDIGLSRADVREEPSMPLSPWDGDSDQWEAEEPEKRAGKRDLWLRDVAYNADGVIASSHPSLHVPDALDDQPTLDQFIASLIAGE